jgi:hypothetical protein
MKHSGFASQEIISVQHQEKDRGLQLTKREEREEEER